MTARNHGRWKPRLLQVQVVGVRELAPLAGAGRVRAAVQKARQKVQMFVPCNRCAVPIDNMPAGRN